MHTVYVKLLQRTSAILGGKAELRKYLRVSMRELESWMAGAEKPPIDVFLKAVDLVSGAPLDPGPATGAAAGFLQTTFEPAQTPQMVEAALDAAIAATGADMGTFQLLRTDGLHIVAQRSFGQPFLDYFAVVDHATGSCGAAMKHASRVVVDDVQRHPIFAGTRAADVMAEARAQSVQSTPLLGASGELLGVFSTHRERKGLPSSRELVVVDMIAKRASLWLDRP